MVANYSSDPLRFNISEFNFIRLHTLFFMIFNNHGDLAILIQGGHVFLHEVTVQQINVSGYARVALGFSQSWSLFSVLLICCWLQCHFRFFRTFITVISTDSGRKRHCFDDQMNLVHFNDQVKDIFTKVSHGQSKLPQRSLVPKISSALHNASITMQRMH